VAKVRVGGGDAASLEKFVERFTAGTTVFKQGDAGCEMFIIQRGQVAISHRVAEADEQIVVLEKGDFFGEMALLEEYPERSATARALTDVEVLRLRGADLQKLLQRKPSVALRMMAKLSERLRETNRRLEELAGKAHMAALPPTPASQGIEAWALLVHDPSGRVFPLRPVGDTSIGRHDPVTGVTPDVDLSGLDPDRTVSRRHASVRCTGDGFSVTEVSASTNGTFVNATKLEPFKASTLAHNDILQLALVALRVHVIKRG